MNTDELRELSDKAAVGPWAVPVANVFRVIAPEALHSNKTEGRTPPYPWRIVADTGHEATAAADAAFIAAAVNYVRDVLASSVAAPSPDGERRIGDVLRVLALSGQDGGPNPSAVWINAAESALLAAGFGDVTALREQNRDLTRQLNGGLRRLLAEARQEAEDLREKLAAYDEAGKAAEAGSSGWMHWTTMVGTLLRDRNAARQEAERLSGERAFWHGRFLEKYHDAARLGSVVSTLRGICKIPDDIPNRDGVLVELIRERWSK